MLSNKKSTKTLPVVISFIFCIAQLISPPDAYSNTTANISPIFTLYPSQGDCFECLITMDAFGGVDGSIQNLANTAYFVHYELKVALDGTWGNSLVWDQQMQPLTTLAFSSPGFAHSPSKLLGGGWHTVTAILYATPYMGFWSNPTIIGDVFPSPSSPNPHNFYVDCSDNTIVPAPSALFLLVPGLAGVAGLRRKMLLK